eukprot:gene18932-20837_t
MPKEGDNYFFKVVLVGDLGIGKSSIFKRYRDGVYFENLSGTVGLDQFAKSIEIDGQKSTTKLSLWDTAGMERAGTLTGGHYSGAHGVLLTYALDDVNSFNDLRGWLENALRYTENAVLFVVGNKVDLDQGDIEVRSSMVTSFCEEHGIHANNCFTVSAKDDEGLDSMWQEIVKTLLASSVPHQQKVKGFQIIPKDEKDGPLSKCC